ncbi:MAG: lysoplasmalogenase [Gemmatimonadetes bacterium]|nr:lysoplasmalogenase [Gemmatimonadota bacterium]
MRTALGTRVVLAAAIVAIGATLLKLPWLHYVAKPTATLACLWLAATATPGRSPRYRRGIVAGLALGTLGDILLMIPDERLFPLGLGSFLVGHLAYLWAMTDGVAFLARKQPVVVIGALLALLLGTLLRAVEPGLRGPVALYMIVLGTMAMQARVRVMVAPDAGARLAAIGATLFMVSDTLLGVERFVMPFPLATVAILATYWGAQWCLARSVEGVPTPATAT